VKSEQTIKLTDIKVQDVSATCIMLVSKFSRVIKAKHGVVIQLRDPNVLNKVAAYASASNSAELKIVYQQIEAEIREHLRRKNPDTMSDIVFKPRPLTARNLICSATKSASPMTRAVCPCRLLNVTPFAR